MLPSSGSESVLKLVIIVTNQYNLSAVHSMTPAGGIGANTAVRDSALLGKLLSEAGGYKEGLTAAYEKEMRVYGSEAVAISYGTARPSFGVSIDENSKTV